MARRPLLRRSGPSIRLSRHLATRGALQRRMHATTPVRFLRRLNLLPEAETAAAPLWEALERWAMDLGLLPEPLIADESVAFDMLPRLSQERPLTSSKEFDDGARIPSSTEDRSFVVDAGRRAEGDSRTTPRTGALREARAIPRVVVAAKPSRKAARYVPAARVSKNVTAVPSQANDSRAARYATSTPASFTTAEHPAPAAPAARYLVADERRDSRGDADRYVAQDAAVDAVAPDLIEAITDGVEPPPPGESSQEFSKAVQTTALDHGAPHQDVTTDLNDVPASRLAHVSISEPALAVPTVRTETERPLTARSNANAEPVVESFADLEEAFSNVVAAADIPRTVEPLTQETVTPPTPPAARPVRRARVEELPVDRTEDASLPRTGSTRTPRIVNAPRSPVPPPEPVEREGDRLFLPVDDGVDRTPAAWAARLAQGMRPSSRSSQTPAAPMPGVDRGKRVATTGPQRSPARAAQRPAEAVTTADVASAVKVSQKTRRFLKPLVGVDPESVAIWQGPVPTQISEANQADAVTVGDDTVLVGSSFVGDLPRDVGLLAHELTHVARRRNPRFIPPVARDVPGMSRVASEEQLARRVETQVIAAAQNDSMNETFPTRATGLPTPVAAPKSAGGSATPATEDVDHVPTVGSEMDWGGLPAPWEPLPTWLTDSPSAAQVVQASVPYSAAPAAAAVAAPTAAPAAGSVQRADMGRALDAPAQATTSPAQGSQPGDAPAVEPDLDQLARQVYAVLKRRLEAESRREQMF